MSTTTIEKKTATQTPAKAKTTRKKAVAAPMNPPHRPGGGGRQQNRGRSQKGAGTERH